MKKYDFLDEKGTFRLERPENYSDLYFPVAGERGLKCALTPELSGDAKLDQNTFLLEPMSAENLHNNRNTRNFWCHIEGVGSWSATGVSAEEIGKKFTDLQDESEVTAGLMWHKLTRKSSKYQLKSEITSFVPVDANVEIMQVEITNTGKEEITFTPIAAIPIYGRSADNIRDHRHVTSLLHRIRTTRYGVEVTPTLSFDERGHRKNDVTYFVYGIMSSDIIPAGWHRSPTANAMCEERAYGVTGTGESPRDFYPVVCDFIGEGGNFERPLAVVKNLDGVKAGEKYAGLEAMGGLRFKEVHLGENESVTYTILIGALKETENTEKTAVPGKSVAQGKTAASIEIEKMVEQLIKRFATREKTEQELAQVKNYWQEKMNVAYRTGDADFDRFMYWVSFQPILRRIYGCSFLPHHDYGKGGRGWRDLWQDCLALLIMNPDGVREMLLSNFGGVRMDGSNATIIGEKQGEFVADRNNITRVWMDHGVWPFMTTKLYLDQTGDLELLEKKVTYFKDKQICRGTKNDGFWNDGYGCIQKTKDGVCYEGTVLEHLLLQHLTAFYEVGEHNELRLRGADWNDALDMAEERGESVAFTNAYAGNMRDLAQILRAYGEKNGKDTVSLAKEIGVLLAEGEKLYHSVEKKKEVLAEYLASCEHEISGEQMEISIEELCRNLEQKAAWMMGYIRENEWVEDEHGNGWFNGYYDNHGERVEGEFEHGVRMMLTGQVFSIMAGTADEKQISAITKSADKYLYREDLGGYRLNTDFGEVKTDLGRMFGFSYGDKENGAVFSHMAVMYANALYRRGFVKEGYKALSALEKQALNFEVSHIYPGIPEYFNGRGRGMYHYLTGAASWYMLTAITEMYGVKGWRGDLLLEPKLLRSQFDEENCAGLTLDFAGRHLNVCYRLKTDADYGVYRIAEVRLDGEEIQVQSVENGVLIPREVLQQLDTERVHKIEVTLH